ncbi:uncharacterized protein At4g04775 [Arabidopsis lyrata subsp. lyrata]|uniref:uncharacterized protein At4g04775 n=1 Tax=Arabidopsis lyrata subsp. lyrata TaxID=81972 RepID=UPI000A29C4C8|nr:uncharacterized protein At4g04775 [Arabidopsis lyrata subsp. lyrata]|eukprot:XP_020887781.1 uncharacterized protein At4g04775 [Arabidopsis lyrata subsp. lyrata]
MEAKVFKSKTDKNPNRRFFGCQLYKEGGNAHCKFFRWLDEEVIGWPKRALAEAQSVIKEKTKKIEELNATILELRGDLERQNLEISSINTEDEKISIELRLQKRIDEMETIVYRQRIVSRGLTGLLVCVVSAIVFCIVSDV